MTTNQVVRARIDGKIKDEASEILANMGLTVSDFVRISLSKVVMEKGLPFDMNIPNKLTADTLAKSERGQDLHKAKDAEQLFKDLDI